MRSDVQYAGLFRKHTLMITLHLKYNVANALLILPHDRPDHLIIHARENQLSKKEIMVQHFHGKRNADWHFIPLSRACAPFYSKRIGMMESGKRG